MAPTSPATHCAKSSPTPSNEAQILSEKWIGEDSAFFFFSPNGGIYFIFLKKLYFTLEPYLQKSDLNPLCLLGFLPKLEIPQIVMAEITRVCVRSKNFHVKDASLYFSIKKVLAVAKKHSTLGRQGKLLIFKLTLDIPYRT